MKASVTVAVLACAPTRAFVPARVSTQFAPATRTSLAVRMSAFDKAKSEAVPFLPRNSVLDEYPLAADVGFDPLGLAKSKEVLLFYRDAEVKHARLAMLAALGWVVAELFDGRLAALTSEPNKLVNPDGDGVGFAPSVLNGGLNGIPLAYWVIVIALTGALEIQFLKKTPQLIAEGKEPGDYAFDPLGLWPEDKAQQNEMRTKEIKNGRLAMLSISAFAFQEAATNTPVVKQTPALFGLTTDEKIAGEQIGEVAQVSFSVISWILHELHLK